MRKKAFMRRIALLVSLLVLMTSTIQTTYGFIVVMTDPVINTFKPEEILSGDLTITKHVEHKLGDSYMVPVGDEFEFEVDLTETYANSGVRVKIGDTMSRIVADEDGVLKGQTDCRLKVLVKGPAITYAYNLPAEDLTFSMNSGILSVVITHTDGATQQVLLVLPDWKEVSS